MGTFQNRLSAKGLRVVISTLAFLISSKSRRSNTACSDATPSNTSRDVQLTNCEGTSLPKSTASIKCRFLRFFRHFSDFADERPYERFGNVDAVIYPAKLLVSIALLGSMKKRIGKRGFANAALAMDDDPAVAGLEKSEQEVN